MDADGRKRNIWRIKIADPAAQHQSEALSPRLGPPHSSISETRLQGRIDWLGRLRKTHTHKLIALPDWLLFNPGRPWRKRPPSGFPRLLFPPTFSSLLIVPPKQFKRERASLRVPASSNSNGADRKRNYRRSFFVSFLVNYVRHGRVRDSR